MKRQLGEGYELDDDVERVDVHAVHDYLANHSYWAEGRNWIYRRYGANWTVGTDWRCRQDYCDLPVYGRLRYCDHSHGCDIS